MKYVLNPLLFVIVCAFMVPSFSFAVVPTPLFTDSGTGRTQLVTCDNGDSHCSFSDLVQLVTKVVSFFVFSIAIPVSIIAIIWAGIMMVLAKGNPGEIAKAKNSLWNVVKGFVLILTAALIVLSIIKLLDVKGDFIWPGLKSGQLNTNGS